MGETFDGNRGARRGNRKFIDFVHPSISFIATVFLIYTVAVTISWMRSVLGLVSSISRWERSSTWFVYVNVTSASPPPSPPVWSRTIENLSRRKEAYGKCDIPRDAWEIRFIIEIVSAEELAEERSCCCCCCLQKHDRFNSVLKRIETLPSKRTKEKSLWCTRYDSLWSNTVNLIYSPSSAITMETS